MMSPVSSRLSLFIAFMAMSLGAIAIVGMFSLSKADAAARANLEERTRDRSAILAQVAASVFSGGTDEEASQLAESVRALGDTTHTGYTLITKQGTVIVESMPEGSAISPLQEPEIVQATQEGSGMAERDGFLHAATAIVSDGVVMGYASASVPSTRLTPELEALESRISMGCVVAALAAIAAAALLAWRFSKTMSDLAPLVAPVSKELAREPEPQIQPAESFKRSHEPIALDMTPSERATHMDVEAAPCDVAAIMSEVERLMNARAKDKNVTLLSMLDTPIPETITSDTAALRELLASMVQAAIDGTSAGSVSVHAAFDPREKPARRLSLTVCDTGAGFTQEQLPDLLSPWKQLAAQVSGVVEATSTVGEGTSITLLFPTGIRSADMVDELEPMRSIAPRARSAPPESGPVESGPSRTPSIGVPPTDRSPGIELAS